MPEQLDTSIHRSGDNELDDRVVPGLSCRDGRCGGVIDPPPANAIDATAELSGNQSSARGLLWIAGGFLFCPCHLPLTLWVLATLFAGTAVGALLHTHVVAAAVLITAIWIAATWRGVRLLK
jgi:MerE protein